MGKQHSAITRKSPDISAKRRHQDVGLERCCPCRYVDHVAPSQWNSSLLSRSCPAGYDIPRRQMFGLLAMWVSMNSRVSFMQSLSSMSFECR